MDEIPDWVKQAAITMAAREACSWYWKKCGRQMYESTYKELCKLYILCQLLLVEMFLRLAAESEEETPVLEDERMPVFSGEISSLVSLPEVLTEFRNTLRLITAISVPKVRYEPMKLELSLPQLVFKPMRLKVTPARFNIFERPPYTPPKFSLEPMAFYVKPAAVRVSPARFYIGSHIAKTE